MAFAPKGWQTSEEGNERYERKPKHPGCYVLDQTHNDLGNQHPEEFSECNCNIHFDLITCLDPFMM